MYSSEFLIKRLEEQQELAPSLRENQKAGGKLVQIIDKMREGANLADQIKVLRSLEAGVARYRLAMERGLADVQKMLPLFARIHVLEETPFESQLEKDKVYAKIKDYPDKIRSICQDAIGQMILATNILNEAYGKDVVQFKKETAKV